MAKKPKAFAFRDRIVEFKRVLASSLVKNERNWREHPPAQRAALRGILNEVGYVDALLARKLKDGRLELIDGHLRAEETPDSEVPVLVVDLGDDEVNTVLATFDPLAAMATTNQDKLNSLLNDIETQEGGLAALLSELGIGRPDEQEGTSGPTNDNVDYPITAVPGEKYEYVMVICQNDTDWAYLQTILQLRQGKSYKNQSVGLGRVVQFARFVEAINEYAKSHHPVTPAAGSSVGT